MSNLTIRQCVQGLLKLQDSGDHATMVGIGPMSPNLIQAVFELARDEDFPPMFIASRNQVDMDEMGAGYVNGWDQTRFAADIKKVADEVGYTGPYYLCRDHGGPWQRDEERNAHLPEEEAMELGISDMQRHRIFRYFLRLLKLSYPGKLKSLESGVWDIFVEDL